MFNNLGVHVIKNPAGTFSFVGTLPMVLADMVPAASDDIRGGRAYTAPNGSIVAPKFPVFTSREDAISYARNRGIQVKPCKN